MTSSAVHRPAAISTGGVKEVSFGSLLESPTAAERVGYPARGRPRNRELNPCTPFAPGWHLEVIGAKLAAVRGGRIRRLIINKPYLVDNNECIFHPPMRERAIAVCRRQQGGMKQRRSRAWADEEAGPLLEPALGMRLGERHHQHRRSLAHRIN
jgi:hypothetical protein